MAQDPIKVDSISISPLEVGDRVIDRNPVTNSIRFQDPSLSSSYDLNEIFGLKSIDKLLVVGKSGLGFSFSTIQDALDSIPPTSTDLWVVLVTPGVYQENVIVEKRNVSFFSFGEVVIESTSTSPCVLIRESVQDTPEHILFRNFKFKNEVDNGDCLKVTGTAGTTLGLVEIDNCSFEASGIGTRQVFGEIFNQIILKDCLFRESSATSSLRLDQVSKVLFKDLIEVKAIQIDFDDTGVLPDDIIMETYLYNVSGEDFSSTLVGEGFISLKDCDLGDLTLSGDRSFYLYDSNIGDLSCNNTVNVETYNLRKGVVSGSGTYTPDIQYGSVLFTAESTKVVFFDLEQKDNSYFVSLEYEIGSLANVKTKLGSSFTIEFAGVETGTVNWKVSRIS